MVQIVCILMGFIFVCLALVLGFLLYNRYKTIDLMIIFIFSLIIFNGFIPVFLINEESNRFFIDYLYIIKTYTVIDILMYYIQNITLLLSSIFGWMIIKKNYRLVLDENKERANGSSSLKKIRNIAKFCLILSIGSYYLYSQPYGGFINLLEYTSSLRSGIITVNNPFSFLQKFGRFSIFSTLLFCGLILDKKYKKTDLLYGLISIIFSIYYLYSLGGRVSFISFFLILLLARIFYKYQQKINLKLVTRMIFVLIGIILGLYYMTKFFIRGTVDLAIIDFFINEISFAFASFRNVINYPGIFLFKHVILSPLYFLPSSIWNLKFGFDTATSFNTFLFTGGYKGEGDISGSVPLDIISFSWLEGGFFGPVIIGILYGLLLAVLQRKLNEISNKGVRSFIFSYMIVEFAILVVPYGDTVHLIQSAFSFIIGFCILTHMLKNKVKSKRSQLSIPDSVNGIEEGE
mgnify:CR=1 FL=1